MSDLAEILRLHALWLEKDREGRRANLRLADLRKADLHGADLRWADLSESNLCGADLDFSSLPLFCGSLNMCVDERLIRQLVYHIASLDYCGDDADITELIGLDVFKRVANAFHQIRQGAVRKMGQQTRSTGTALCAGR